MRADRIRRIEQAAALAGVNADADRHPDAMTQRELVRVASGAAASNLLTQGEAGRQLQIRDGARADLLAFARAVDIPGKPATDDPDDEFFQPVETVMAAHHRLLLSKLSEVSRTPHGRLMVFMPPGSAKSTYASVVFPAYYLGAQANRRVILASYGDDLTRKLGRRTRSILRQPRYRAIFGTELAADIQGAQDFALTNSSEYLACGILSGVTGNRAHGIIIDDPVKGRQEANSEAMRAKTWDAYSDDLKTRLVPGGWIVLIQTRWHEDDLAGRILPADWNGRSGKVLCRDGNEWEVLCIQARCEVEGDPLGRKVGDYLWPEWFDAKHWAQFEQNPRTWAALYQQRPAPEDGDLFRPDRIGVIDSVASDVRFIRGWDLASTTDGDWTVGAKVGKLADGRFVIADIVRLRAGPDERDTAILNTAGRDGRSTRISIPQDPGQAGKTQVAYLTRQLAGYRVQCSPESGDKVTRAEPFAAQVNAGNVLMVSGPWNDALIGELRMFPNGRHDDQVDALARAFAELIVAPKPARMIRFNHMAR